MWLNYALCNDTIMTFIGLRGQGFRIFTFDLLRHSYPPLLKMTAIKAISYVVLNIGFLGNEFKYFTFDFLRHSHPPFKDGRPHILRTTSHRAVILVSK